MALSNNASFVLYFIYRTDILKTAENRQISKNITNVRLIMSACHFGEIIALAYELRFSAIKKQTFFF